MYYLEQIQLIPKLVFTAEKMGNRKNSVEGGARAHGQTGQQSGSSLPLVSVIAATFNAEKNLEPCILSVLAQTYDNVELIIIDGGSTDGTLDILKRYDDRIDYWISEKDAGVYDALNKGIALARGEWLFFLGADDRLADEDVLNRVFSKPRHSRFIYGNVKWGDTGRLYDGKFDGSKLFHHNICQQAIFYHRDLFDIFGGFDLKYEFWADWAFNIRAFAHEASRPVFLDTVVSEYSLEGMTTRDVSDRAFRRDREAIFKESFGNLALLRIKIGHFFRSLMPSAERKA